MPATSQTMSDTPQLEDLITRIKTLERNRPKSERSISHMASVVTSIIGTLVLLATFVFGYGQLTKEVADIKGDISEIKTDMKDFEKDQRLLFEKSTGFMVDMSNIKEQFKEHRQENREDSKEIKDALSEIKVLVSK